MNWQNAALAMAGVIGSGVAVVHGILVQRLMVKPFGADLGTTTTQEVLGKLRDKADRKQIKDVQELKRLLKEELLAILNAANTRPVQQSRWHAGSDSGGRA